MYEAILSVVAPVVIAAAIGFIWEKSGRGYATDFVMDLTMTVGMPCLVFSTLARMDIAPDAFARMAWASAISIVLFLASGAAVLRMTGLSLRAFLPSLTFPNTGNMGLSLNLLAFGEPGLALAIVYFTVCTLFQFTVGVAINSGSTSIKPFLRMPVLYALAAAVGFLASGVEPPAWLMNTTKILGSMAVPVMLVTLGVSLGRLRVAALPRAVLLSLLRVGLGFGVGVGLAHAFGLDGTARGTLILQCAMPVAVFNYLFAQRYKTSPEEVAGLVVVSTLLSFLSLPALLWFVM